MSLNHSPPPTAATAITPIAPITDVYFRTLLDAHQFVAGQMLAAQRNQLAFIAACQTSASAAMTELTDQWICRFGGGVPIDG